MEDAARTVVIEAEAAARACIVAEAAEETAAMQGAAMRVAVSAVSALQQRCAAIEAKAAAAEQRVESLIRFAGRCVPLPMAWASDVTVHDVNWGARGARRHAALKVTHGGFGLALGTGGPDFTCWAQGSAGVTASGKHLFQINVTSVGTGCMYVGWVSPKISIVASDSVGSTKSAASGVTYFLGGIGGRYRFGTAPVSADSYLATESTIRPGVLGCLLDLDATPSRMRVFVDGAPLAKQCDYAFPKDGHAWFPTVGLGEPYTAFHSV